MSPTHKFQSQKRNDVPGCPGIQDIDDRRRARNGGGTLAVQNSWKVRAGRSHGGCQALTPHFHTKRVRPRHEK